MLKNLMRSIPLPNNLRTCLRDQLKAASSPRGTPSSHTNYSRSKSYCNNKEREQTRSTKKIGSIKRCTKSTVLYSIKVSTR